MTTGEVTTQIADSLARMVPAALPLPIILFHVRSRSHIPTRRVAILLPRLSPSKSHSRYGVRSSIFSTRTVENIIPAMSPKARSISSYFIKPAAATASAASQKPISTAAKDPPASPSNQSKENIENVSPNADKGSATPASGLAKKRKLDEASMSGCIAHVIQPQTYH